MNDLTKVQLKALGIGILFTILIGLIETYL